LASWVWTSFNPKQKISEAMKKEEAVKIKKACNAKDDVID
jgi:hypothetical protein